MRPTPHRTHATHRPRAALLVLVLAMLLAQALGLMHQTLHGPASRVALVPEAELGAWLPPHDCDEPGAHGPASHVQAFGHEAGSAECRLFDQIGQDWALATPWAPPAAPPAAPPWARGRPAPTLAAQAAGYLARGPPPGLVLPS
jgi:hypothetical protein